MGHGLSIGNKRMDNLLRASLLKSIELQGSVSSNSRTTKVYVNESLSNVLDSSSGKRRIRPFKVSLFNLILSQPLTLHTLSPFEIRCLNCSKVITYPAWHYELKFDGSIFEYFVCFSETSVSKVTLNCKRG